MKILNFGSCNIDIVCSVEHIVRPGETISADTVEHFVGGKGLNQSVALANAGADIYHAGCIGADGEILRSFMEKKGVNLKYLRTTQGKSGQAIIQVDKNGENAIFLYKGANHEITKEYIDMDILEQEIYHGRLSQDALVAMDSCREVKEIQKLDIRKAKKG